LQTSKEIGADVSASHGKLAVAIGRSTLFGILSRLSQVGTRLITIPIVVGHLGLAGYGIWSIIMTTSAYMRFGSVGIKSAFQKYVADATGNGDFKTASRLLSTGTAIMVVLSDRRAYPERVAFPQTRGSGWRSAGVLERASFAGSETWK
jgi:hypothetical protein